MRDHGAAFEQQFLNVAVAEAEAVIESDAVANDFSGKAVMLVTLAVGGRGHAELPIGVSVSDRSSKAALFSGSQSHRGKSQSPVAWVASVEETKQMQPTDKALSGRGASHRAVTQVNPEVASENKIF
jgi:hypothetical protein